MFHKKIPLKRERKKKNAAGNVNNKKEKHDKMLQVGIEC